MQKVVQEGKGDRRSPSKRENRGGGRGGTVLALFADLDQVYGQDQEVLASKQNGDWMGWTVPVLQQRVMNLAAGLVRLSVKKGERVAVLGGGCPEGLIAELASQHAGTVSVPIDRSFDEDSLVQILRQTLPKVVFVEGKEDVDRVRKALRRSKIKGSRTVVVFEPLERRRKNTMSINELEEEGAEAPPATHNAVGQRAKKVGPRSVATIVYTGGTTGPPKGVALTHQSIQANVYDSLHSLPLRAGTTCLSYLPVSRSVERIVGQYTMMAAGVTIAYAQDLQTVPDDIQQVRPHVMVSAPRLLERVHASLESSVRGPWLKRKLFDWAMGVAQEAVDHGMRSEALPPRLEKRLEEAERLVFSKIRQRIGGRLESFVCWGARIPERVERFFWAIGVGVYAGYGLTETGGLVTCNSVRAHRTGSVGRPLEGFEVKVDTQQEDAGTGLGPGVGEVLVKGDGVMKAYWKDEKQTRQAVKKKWLHTGDLGRLDDEGYLYILGRKEDLITLFDGQKVAPGPIEDRFRLQPHIDQVVLFGDGQDHLTALLVPDFGSLKEFVEKERLATHDPAVLVNVTKVQDLLRSEVGEVNAGLEPHEQVKRFRILPRPLSREEGEVTSVLMVRRGVVQQRFADAVDEMYDDASVMDAAGLSVI